MVNVNVNVSAAARYKVHCAATRYKYTEHGLGMHIG